MRHAETRGRLCVTLYTKSKAFLNTATAVPTTAKKSTAPRRDSTDHQDGTTPLPPSSAFTRHPIRQRLQHTIQRPARYEFILILSLAQLNHQDDTTPLPYSDETLPPYLLAIRPDNDFGIQASVQLATNSFQFFPWHS
jgi:hypothetical protein